MPGVRGCPCRLCPPEQHLGSVLREQKAAAGREGGYGGSRCRGPAPLRAAPLPRGRGAGANFLLPTPPKMTAFKKKREEGRNTNTAKQPLPPDAEFLSPLICLLFAFVSGRRWPAERDPGGRAAREAGSPHRGRHRRTALGREAEREPRRALGLAAGPVSHGGSGREPGMAPLPLAGAAGGRRAQAAPLHGRPPASAGAAAEKPRSVLR